MKKPILAFVFTLGLVCPVHAAGIAGATLAGDGIEGAVSMTETVSGAILVEIYAEGIPAGEHGFHIHETGKCEIADGFKSAGGHLTGNLQHGVEEVGGPHAGDMPNVHAQEDGIVKAEFFTYGFTLAPEAIPRLVDDDGASIILHAGPDDYRTQPSGNAGDRIACGVIFLDN